MPKLDAEGASRNPSNYYSEAPPPSPPKNSKISIKLKDLDAAIAGIAGIA